MNRGVLYQYVIEQDDENARLVVPDDGKKNILHAYHDAPMAGHYGIDKTVSRIFKRYYWIGIRRAIVSHKGKCVPCQRYKISNLKPAGLFQTTANSQRFEVLAVDLFGPLRPPMMEYCIFCLQPVKNDVFNSEKT